MILKAAETQLLVIDVQARLMPAIDGSEALLSNLGLLLEAAERLSVPAVATEQYPSGLGNTLPEIADNLPQGTHVIEKETFSACNAPGFLDILKRNRSTLLVTGVETHVCVLQTALDLASEGDARAVECAFTRPLGIMGR